MHKTVILVGLSLGFQGCNTEEAKPLPAQSRFVAVEANPDAEIDAFCDKRFKGTEAPTFVLPPSVADKGPGVPAIKKDRYVWVNFWATWCGPCRDEMPMLASWDKELDSPQKKLDLYFYSVDDDPALLTKFWSENKDLGPTVPTARLEDFAQLGTWLESTGLGIDTPIPVHFLIAPGGKLSCVKMGAVSESDKDRVKAWMNRG